MPEASKVSRLPPIANAAPSNHDTLTATMAEQQMCAPRVTTQYLDSFVGRLVTVVGKVTQLRGDQATIDADGTVTVILNRVGPPYPRHCRRAFRRTLTSAAGCPPGQWQCRSGHRQGEPRPVHQGAQLARLGLWRW